VRALHGAGFPLTLSLSPGGEGIKIFVQVHCSYTATGSADNLSPRGTPQWHDSIVIFLVVRELLLLFFFLLDKRPAQCVEVHVFLVIDTLQAFVEVVE
jgi:hypothetical protein